MQKILSLLFFFLSVLLQAQEDGLNASFPFDKKVAKDEVSGIQPRLYEVAWVRDRFGNQNSAVYLQGGPGSFINLGTDEKLKPIVGSVSLWLNIEHPMLHGRGVESNPIYMVRAHANDDYCEGVYLGYDYLTNNLNANTTLSEQKQRTIYSTAPFSLREWHHVVIAYNNDYLWFYLDAELQGKIPKGFPTSFLRGDSVLLGNKNSVKNERYFNGSIDEVKIYNKVLSQKEVNALYKQANPNRLTVFLTVIATVIGFVGLIMAIAAGLRYRLTQFLKAEKEKNELNNKLLEQEIRVLKSQMDPHFVFNSLNTILQFIITGQNEIAEAYLTKFSKLLRMILESSTNETVSLKEEIELIYKYLEIESLRFNDVFKPEIIVQPGIREAEVHIPHMMIQPFIENAIWHGLRGISGQKTLRVEFSVAEEGVLSVIIEDNGVGIANAPKKPHLKSLAVSFIKQRLELLGKIYNKKFFLNLSERQPNGTRVELTIPFIKNTNQHAGNNN